MPYAHICKQENIIIIENDRVINYYQYIIYDHLDENLQIYKR